MAKPSPPATTENLPGGVVHDLPDDLRDGLRSSAAALAAWVDITPLARNEFICWVEDAKRPATRERRIRRTGEELEEGMFAPAAGPAASIDSGRAAEDGQIEVCGILGGGLVALTSPVAAEVAPDAAFAAGGVSGGVVRRYAVSVGARGERDAEPALRGSGRARAGR